MTIKEAQEINTKLSEVMSKRLPVKTAFAIQKNKKKLQEIADFADQRNDEIVQRYAARDENGETRLGVDNDGNPIEGTILIGDPDGYVKERNELQETEVDIEFCMVHMEDLERCDEDGYDTLSPNDMEALATMIEE